MPIRFRSNHRKLPIAAKNTETMKNVHEQMKRNIHFRARERHCAQNKRLRKSFKMNTHRVAKLFIVADFIIIMSRAMTYAM